MLELWFLGKWASLVKTNAKYSGFWFSICKWFSSRIFKLKVWSARQASPCHNPEKLGVNKCVCLAVMGNVALIWRHASYEKWMVKAAVKGKWSPKSPSLSYLLEKKIKWCPSEIPIIWTSISKNKKGTWV